MQGHVAQERRQNKAQEQYGNVFMHAKRDGSGPGIGTEDNILSPEEDLSGVRSFLCSRRPTSAEFEGFAQAFLNLYICRVGAIP
jgi:hypothetical protein